MRFAAICLIAFLTLAQLAHAEEGQGFLASLQLFWRPDPAEHEVVENPAPVMNGYSILNYYSLDAIGMQRSAGSFGNSIDWTLGPRLIFGRGISDRDTIEVCYFGLYQMNRSVFDPTTVTAGVGAAAGTGINNRADYRSVTNNAELHLRHWLTPEFSFLAGIRYLNWHENMDAAFDPVNPFAGVVLPPGSIHQTYHTSNNMIGLQVGGDWKQPINDHFGIELGSKVGIFANRTDFDATLSIPGLPSLPAGAGNTRASMIAELGLVGTYSVTSYLKLRAGYQVMWIEGLALAPDQLNGVNFVGASTISNRSGVFLHGAIAGAELRW